MCSWRFRRKHPHRAFLVWPRLLFEQRLNGWIKDGSIRGQGSCAKKTAYWWWTFWRLFGNAVYLCPLVLRCSKSWCTSSEAKENRLVGFQQRMPELLRCWQSVSEARSITCSIFWDRCSTAVYLKLLLVPSDSPGLGKSFPGFSHHWWILQGHWVAEAFLLDVLEVWVVLLLCSEFQCKSLLYMVEERFCSRHNQKCLCAICFPTVLGHSPGQVSKDPVIQKRSAVSKGRKTCSNFCSFSLASWLALH